MAFPKNALFSEEDQALAQRSLTFSHPARLFITRTLQFDGPQYVHQLERQMPLVQASISHHLNKLRGQGIIDVEVRRLENLYYLNPEQLQCVAEQYAAWFKEILEGRSLGRIREVRNERGERKREQTWKNRRFSIKIEDRRSLKKDSADAWLSFF